MGVEIVGLALAVAGLGWIGLTGATLGMGSCPNIAPMKGFELEKFKGGWFVIQKFSTSSTCLSYNFTTGSDGILRIIQSSKHSVLDAVGVDDFVYTGVLTFPDPRKEPGRMRVKFPLNVVGEADYLIFMTDYVNYGVIFSCQKILFGHRKSVSILSRTSTLNKTTLAQVRQQLNDEGLDPDDLSTIDQSDCPTVEDGTTIQFGGDKTYEMDDNNMTLNPSLAVSASRAGTLGGGARKAGGGRIRG